MNINNPGLYGIKHSNRDFTNKSTWGKNQFNSSFPASLSAYLDKKGFENVYLTLNKDLKVIHQKISTSDFFGLAPTSDDLFYSFESAYTPYEQLLVGHLPRVDLVTQRKSSGQALKPIEIKLTALPDNTTCELSENQYGTEIVIRPDTIVYLACSIAFNFRNKLDELRSHFSSDFKKIADWTEGTDVWAYLPQMLETIDAITLSILDKQEPILMQPIWKTQGKSPALAENCLDVFVWSNFAFTQLFLDVARGELSTNNRITRQIRTIIWLFKMLYDFSLNGQFNHAQIIDALSYNNLKRKFFKDFPYKDIYTHTHLCTCKFTTHPYNTFVYIYRHFCVSGNISLYGARTDQPTDTFVYLEPTRRDNRSRELKHNLKRVYNTTDRDF